MKILFVLFLSLICGPITAQSFIPLENSPYEDSVRDIQELDNGNFIYVKSYRKPRSSEEFQEILTVTDSFFTVVKLVDENFQPLAEFPIKTTNANEIITGDKILLTDNGFLIFCYTYSLFSPYQKMFLLELDEDFNEIRRNVFAHAPNIFLPSNPIINYDGNIVIVGMYNNISSGQVFLAEFDFDGNLLNIAESLLGFTDDFVQLPDSSYNVFFRISNKTNHLSADWAGFSEDIYHNLGLSFTANNGHQLLEDGRWLFSGTARIVDSFTMEEVSISQAVVINPDDTTTKIIYQNRPPDDVGMLRGFRAMDMIDTTCIYFSNTYASCFPFVYPKDSCFNFVSIHSIQIDGTENWTQYLGFDAAYYPTKILATQDRGVLLVVYRYNETDNLEEEGDMYFIKLDKEGNVDFTTGTEEEEPPFILQQFLVYPNPASDLLRYTFGGSNINAPIIKIFDSAGRLLLTDEISDKETDISALVPGYYFYEILDKNKRLQTGKLVKE